MLEVTQAGTIFLREDTLLPQALRLDSEPYLPGWALVKNLDGLGLSRKIQEAGWTFFCLAGELNAATFGLSEEQAVDRAIARILANPKSAKFNSVEITRVVSAASKRFLGVAHVTVSACSRHVQEGMFLLPPKDAAERERAKAAAA